jgi:hypothetical protein
MYFAIFVSQVIKIVPGHAFFDTLSLRCPENAPFSVQFKKNLGENQPLYCPLYLALATLHNPVQTVIIPIV